MWHSQIVRHKIDPGNVFPKQVNLKPSQIPIGRWRGERDTVIVSCELKYRIECFEKQNKVTRIIRFTTAI
ncbi:glycoside hydrolase family 18 protein [Alternaria alternata]|nr:glycoside hydrolase family 18 protein [Alternaria alternata]